MARPPSAANNITIAMLRRAVSKSTHGRSPTEAPYKYLTDKYLTEEKACSSPAREGIATPHGLAPC